MSSGNFFIIFSSSGEVKINPKSLPFNSINHIKRFELEVNETTVYFPTTFDIILFGDDGNFFIIQLKITVVENNSNNKNYICINSGGKCTINDLILSKINISTFTFKSNDLNQTFQILGKSIKIVAQNLLSKVI